jgi:CheY-like chemotaxis protein
MRRSSDLTPQAADEPSRERFAGSNTTASHDPLRGRTILVGDADADTRELYRLSLQSAGAKICDAQDGRDALAKAFSDRPDAIIVNVQLPFIDGVELCRLLRLDPATARVPLLLVTTNPDAPAVQDLWRAGADAVFTKPFPPESLIPELAELIRSGHPRFEISGGSDSGATPTAPRDRRRRGAHEPAPVQPPPNLRCPMCDRRLQYERSHTGGIGTRGAEQWDYFSCLQCGTFQYRHRTRKLRRVLS